MRYIGLEKGLEKGGRNRLEFADETKTEAAESEAGLLQ
jgi:hypothetical protein